MRLYHSKVFEQCASCRVCGAACLLWQSRSVAGVDLMNMQQEVSSSCAGKQDAPLSSI